MIESKKFWSTRWEEEYVTSIASALPSCDRLVLLKFESGGDIGIKSSVGWGLFPFYIRVFDMWAPRSFPAWAVNCVIPFASIPLSLSLTCGPISSFPFRLLFSSFRCGSFSSFPSSEFVSFYVPCLWRGGRFASSNNWARSGNISGKQFSGEYIGER